MREVALEQLLDHVGYARAEAARYDRLAGDAMDAASHRHVQAMAEEWRHYADRLWWIYLRASGPASPGTREH
jgi:hypothetical protein